MWFYFVFIVLLGYSECDAECTMPQYTRGNFCYMFDHLKEFNVTEDVIEAEEWGSLKCQDRYDHENKSDVVSHTFVFKNIKTTTCYCVDMLWSTTTSVLKFRIKREATCRDFSASPCYSVFYGIPTTGIERLFQCDAECTMPQYTRGNFCYTSNTIELNVTKDVIETNELGSIKCLFRYDHENKSHIVVHTFTYKNINTDTCYCVDMQWTPTTNLLMFSIESSGTCRFFSIGSCDSVHWGIPNPYTLRLYKCGAECAMPQYIQERFCYMQKGVEMDLNITEEAIATKDLGSFQCGDRYDHPKPDNTTENTNHTFIVEDKYRNTCYCVNLLWTTLNVLQFDMRKSDSCPSTSNVTAQACLANFQTVDMLSLYEYGDCVIPRYIRGHYFFMEDDGNGTEIIITKDAFHTSNGDLRYQGRYEHPKHDVNAEGANYTLILAGSGKCYCVDVLQRTPLVLQIRKEIADFCPVGSSKTVASCEGVLHGLPDPDTLTTLFSIDADEKVGTCGKMLHGLYQFSYDEGNIIGGGECNHPDNKIEACYDDYSKTIIMKYVKCQHIPTSGYKTLRYNCYGSWVVRRRGANYKYAAISGVNPKQDKREKYKCLMTRQDNNIENKKERWVMSRFARCGALNSEWEGPVRFGITKIANCTTGRTESSEVDFTSITLESTSTSTAASTSTSTTRCPPTSTAVMYPLSSEMMFVVVFLTLARAWCLVR